MSRQIGSVVLAALSLAGCFVDELQVYRGSDGGAGGSATTSGVGGSGGAVPLPPCEDGVAAAWTATCAACITNSAAACEAMRGCLGNGPCAAAAACLQADLSPGGIAVCGGETPQGVVDYLTPFGEHCALECLGTNFECGSNWTTPAPTAQQDWLTLRLVEAGATELGEAAARHCADPSCQTDNGSKPLTSEGFVSFLVDLPIADTFEVTGADLPSYRIQAPPWYQTASYAFELATAAELDALAQSAGATLTPGSAHIWVTAVDCLEAKAADVAVELLNATSPPSPLYLQNFQIVSGATETRSDAHALFLNVTPGESVNIVGKVNGSEVSRVIVQTQADTITRLQLQPTPTN